jgi:hypothetical protein
MILCLFRFFSSFLLTLPFNFNKNIVYTLNNTRHASAGFGRISAPRWVTFLRGLGGEIH